MFKLNQYIWNRICPEGSNAEVYLAEECMTFYSRCLWNTGIDTNQSAKNQNAWGRPLGSKVCVIDRATLYLYIGGCWTTLNEVVPHIK